MTPPTLSSPMICALALANFVVAVGGFVVIGIVEPISEDLRVSIAQAGSLLTIYAVVTMLAAPILVALTGHMARRHVLCFGLAVFGAAAALGAMAPGFGTLAATRVIGALGASVVTPITMGLAALLAPQGRRTRTMSLVFLGITLAQVVGIPAGSWLGYTFGWRAALAGVAALTLLSTVLVWLSLPHAVPFQATSLSDLGRALRAPRLMLAVSFTASFMSAVFILQTFIAPVMADAMGFERNAITLTLALFGSGAVLGNLIGGSLSDHLGHMTVLRGATLLLIPLLSFYSFLPQPTVLALTWTVIWAAVGWALGAAQQARLAAESGSDASAALALHAACLSGGSAVGAALGGVILSIHGYSALGIAAAICTLIAYAHLEASRRIGVTA